MTETGESKRMLLLFGENDNFTKCKKDLGYKIVNASSNDNIIVFVTENGKTYQLRNCSHHQLDKANDKIIEVEENILDKEGKIFINYVYCGKGYVVWHDSENNLIFSLKFRDEDYLTNPYLTDIKYVDVCGEYLVAVRKENFEATLWRITVEENGNFYLVLEPFEPQKLPCEPTSVACGEQFFAALCQGTVLLYSYLSGSLERSVIFTYSPTIKEIKASDNYILGLDCYGSLHIHGHIDGLPSKLEECQIARNVRKFFAFAQHMIFQTETFELWGVGQNNKSQLCPNFEKEYDKETESKDKKENIKKVPIKYARPTPLGISSEIYSVVGGIGYTGIFTAPFDYSKLYDVPELLTPAMLSSPPVNLSSFLPESGD